MGLFRGRYRIESARLLGYDYSTPGAYFVTINTRGMICWFGDVVDGKMIRNHAGNIIYECWSSTPDHHVNVSLDEFVIMPNHVHGILVINKRGGRDVAGNVSTTRIKQPLVESQTMDRTKTKPTKIPSPKPGSLGTIVRSFKSAATKQIHDAGSADFTWQPRFHDHIIRNDAELNRIREYIIANPVSWREKGNWQPTPIQ